MSDSSVLKTEKFWQILRFLSNLENKTSWDEVCSNLSLTNKQLNSFLIFLREVSFEIKVESSDGENKFLIPPSESPSVEINFNLIEWLEFQAHFPYLDEAKGEPFHDNFQMKMEDFEKEHQSLDLFSPLDVFEHSQKSPLKIYNDEDDTQYEVLTQIEKAVVAQEVVQLSFLNSQHKDIAIFPRKIVYLDGELSLVGENIQDNTLMQMTIQSISHVSIEDSTWSPVFTSSEMNEFVSSMRKMSDFSTRLILKIKSYEKFQLNLGHQFFENPCVFTNGVGEIIWAATIEPNEEIFDWLASLGQDVEIIESSEFKRKYLNYCESKLKKLA